MAQKLGEHTTPAEDPSLDVNTTFWQVIIAFNTSTRGPGTLFWTTCTLHTHVRLPTQEFSYTLKTKYTFKKVNKNLRTMVSKV